MSATHVTTTQVVAVLLADGWHRVVPGSFSVGALGLGAEADLGIPGFRFEEADTASPYRPAALAGPLDSILAVRQGHLRPPPPRRTGPSRRQPSPPPDPGSRLAACSFLLMTGVSALASIPRRWCA